MLNVDLHITIRVAADKATDPKAIRALGRALEATVHDLAEGVPGRLIVDDNIVIGRHDVREWQDDDAE